VNPSWYSAETLAGVLAALLFAGVCRADMRLAILVFTAAGCIRGVQVGAFSGQELTQGLLPVEVLGTVLIGVWCFDQGVLRPRRIRRASFNTPLFLLVPCSLLSFIIGFTWFDPGIPLDHMNWAVSVGQILLVIWPIGTYLVVANSIHDDVAITTVRKVIVLLAVPSLLLFIAPPDAAPYLFWSTTFALPASSLCFAEFFHTRSIPRRLGLLILTVAPAVYGFATGKAFFYSYVVVSMAVIAWLQARRLVLAVAPLAFAAYVVSVPVATSSFTPPFMRRAVEKEETQQSLGGRGGRDQLIVDGLAIWSRSPVFGVGPGNTYPYMLRYSSLGTPHNQYVNLLVELGALGLACFGIFAYRAARTGLQLWRTAREPAHQVLALGWLGLFGGMLAGGMFGDFMIPSIRNSGLELFAMFYVQWVLLGLIVSASALERGSQAAL
jgi:O-antigen ligase